MGLNEELEMMLNKKTKKKKRKKREREKIVRDLSPRPRLRVLHLTARLKLQSAITLVKFARFFSKVNQVI